MKIEQTTKAYDLHADEYEHEADVRGARVEDIDRIFSYLNKENPLVIELGCAHGRDAEEIVKRTNRYVGMDASAELISKAKKRLPGYQLEVSTFDKFQFPESADAVVAFASLLHADKDVLRAVLARATESLNGGGIIYLSLQGGDYREHVKKDEMGTRNFYYYRPKDILDMVPEQLKQVYLDEYKLRDKEWFNMILQRK